MNEIINTIIIEDEQNYISSLEIMLKQSFPWVNIIGKAGSVSDAVGLLNFANPSLVFLDINLPDGTAFDILEKIDKRHFEIIFITAYSEFAFRAFEVSAVHYLMKPISLELLHEAIDRFIKIKSSGDFEEKLTILKDSLVKRPQKILLPSINGVSVYNIDDIVRCEADNNYSIIFFSNKQRILVSKPLQSIDKILNDLDFVRIHNKHLVNLRYVKRYNTGVKASVTLSDSSEVPVARLKKIEFAERLKTYAKTV